jgi:hypothetical protein
VQRRPCDRYKRYEQHPPLVGCDTTTKVPLQAIAPKVSRRTEAVSGKVRSRYAWSWMTGCHSDVEIVRLRCTPIIVSLLPSACRCRQRLFVSRSPWASTTVSIRLAGGRNAGQKGAREVIFSFCRISAGFHGILSRKRGTERSDGSWIEFSSGRSRLECPSNALLEHHPRVGFMPPHALPSHACNGLPILGVYARCHTCEFLICFDSYTQASSRCAFRQRTSYAAGADQCDIEPSRSVPDASFEWTIPGLPVSGECIP